MLAKVFDISIFGEATFMGNAVMGKRKESTLVEKSQEPNYESDCSLEVVGVQNNHLAKGRSRGRVPFLRSHGRVAKVKKMEAELRCNKMKRGSEELEVRTEMTSSDQGGNAMEPRKPTEVSSAQDNMRNVPKLLGEVEPNAQQQKDANGHHFHHELQNKKPVMKHQQDLKTGRKDAKVSRRSTHPKAVRPDEAPVTGRSTRRSSILKSAQSDMLHGLRFTQIVEPNHQKQKDGDNDPSIHLMNLSAASAGPPHMDCCNDILTDVIENDGQQPKNREDNSECAFEKTEIGELEPTKVTGKAIAIKNTELLVSNGKEQEESNCTENCQDSDECSVEILEVLSPHKAYLNGGESYNLQQSKRTGRCRPFLRSDGRVTNSLLVETKVKGDKCKHGSEKISIGPEASISKQGLKIKEQSQSSRMKSAHVGETHVPTSSKKLKLNHHLLKEGDEDPVPLSANLRTSSQGEHLPLCQNMEHSQERDAPPSVSKICSYRRFLSNRRPVTAEERLKAKQAARKFCSTNPFFMIAMPSTYVYGQFFMHIPRDFAKDYMKKKVRDVSLVVPDGRRWPARWLDRGYRVGLSKGWASFVWENNLEEGDVCIFELVNRMKVEFMVFIFRVVEEMVPLVKIPRRKIKGARE